MTPRLLFVASFGICFLLFVGGKQVFDAVFLTERVTGCPTYQKVCED